MMITNYYQAWLRNLLKLIHAHPSFKKLLNLVDTINSRLKVDTLHVYRMDGGENRWVNRWYNYCYINIIDTYDKRQAR